MQRKSGLSYGKKFRNKEIKEHHFGLDVKIIQEKLKTENTLHSISNTSLLTLTRKKEEYFHSKNYYKNFLRNNKLELKLYIFDKENFQ